MLNAVRVWHTFHAHTMYLADPIYFQCLCKIRIKKVHLARNHLYALHRDPDPIRFRCTVCSIPIWLRQTIILVVMSGIILMTTMYPLTLKELKLTSCDFNECIGVNLARWFSRLPNSQRNNSWGRHSPCRWHTGCFDLWPYFLDLVTISHLC